MDLGISMNPRPWIGVTQLVNYGVGVRRRVELMLNELTQDGSLHGALCCYDAGDDWGHSSSTAQKIRCEQSVAIARMASTNCIRRTTVGMDGHWS